LLFFSWLGMAFLWTCYSPLKHIWQHSCNSRGKTFKIVSYKVKHESHIPTFKASLWQVYYPSNSKIILVRCIDFILMKLYDKSELVANDTGTFEPDYKYLHNTSACIFVIFLKMGFQWDSFDARTRTHTQRERETSTTYRT
jgi:hypothetical protein